MNKEKTKEALEALETLESIAHMSLHGSVETSQFKCVDTIRAAIAEATDVNVELLEALKGMVARFYYDNDGSPQLKAARKAIANAEAQKVVGE